MHKLAHNLRGWPGRAVSKKWFETRPIYIRHAGRCLGSQFDLDCLQAEDLWKLQAYGRHKHFKPETINKLTGCLKALCRDLGIDKQAEFDRAGRLRVPASDKEVGAWTRQQRDFILAEAESGPAKMAPEPLAFLKFVAFTGVRASEALGVRWKQVFLEAGYVRIIEGRVGQDTTDLKTRDSARTLHLPKLALAVLAGIRPKAPDPDGFVFLGARGRPLDLHNFRARCWLPLIDECELCGVPRFEFKAFRHTAATIMLQSGLKTRFEVAAYLGHSVEILEQRYAKWLPRPDDLDEALGLPQLKAVK